MLKKNKKEVLDFFQKDGVKLTIVSGIVTTKPNLIKWVDQNIPEIGMITSKSYQIEPTEGNREPIIVEQSVGNFGNAVGLRNPGMEQGYRDLRKLKEHGLKAILNVSLAAKKAEDFIILIKKFEDIADIFELNFSCPHAESGFGSSIGSNKEIVKDYLQKIRKVTNSLLFPKLTPNVENIGEIAQVCIDQGADGIVAINTVGPELYIEPHTKKAILFNPQGHQGGKSGDWIKEIALEKIKEIREAIGSEIPIIGMGGVSCASDVIKMQNAGANVVGIGSVLARVKMEDRKTLFRLLKEDVENGSDKATNLLNKERLAQYKPYKITKIIDKTETLRIIQLEGKIDYQASQYVFLWVPDVGEKPFAIASNKPLSFVIRKKPYDKKQNKGLVTHALFNLKDGQELLIRGVYGKEAPILKNKNAVLVVGGSGIALVPALVKKLHQEGKNIVVYYGVKDQEEVIFEEKISQYAQFVPVADEGVLARVLNVVKEDLLKKSKDFFANTTVYNIGSTLMMNRAITEQEEIGIAKENILLALETKTMCGIGLCGECECGGKLLCHEGTFVSKAFIDKNEINILDL